MGLASLFRPVSPDASSLRAPVPLARQIGIVEAPTAFATRATMAKFSYQDDFDLRVGNIEIPPTSRPDFTSCYVFAFPKAGSCFLNNMVYRIMQESGVPVIDIPVFLFSNGISVNAAVFDYNSIFFEKGYCYAGFRIIPAGLQGTMSKLPGRKILLVRDPRDMLVSLFYSLKFSHRFPQERTVQFSFAMHSDIARTKRGIDDFCLSSVGIYTDIFNGYADLINDESVKIVRYEDIIFEKLTFANMLCEWFSLAIGRDRLKQIVADLDIVPRNEMPTEHIRQVAPGDHRRKLQVSTIKFLNIAFRDFMRKFDYQASDEFEVRNALKKFARRGY